MAITTIEQAQQATMLQAKIDAITGLKAMATQAKDANWLIGRLTAIEPDSGAEHPLITGALDQTASQLALSYCLEVYDQMLTDLAAARDALLA